MSEEDDYEPMLEQHHHPEVASAAAASASAFGTASSSSSRRRHDYDEDDEEETMFPSASLKPALKKNVADHDGDPTNAATATSTSGRYKTGDEGHSSSMKKNLKWDEKAIEEHDLLRGTRMKIDEPNTPFTQYDSGQESDDSRRPKSPVEPGHRGSGAGAGSGHPQLSWDNLQNRLDTVAAVRAAYPSSPSSSYHSDGDEERKKEEMRQIEFKEHRKRHYNEMELVRKFRQEHPDAVMESTTIPTSGGGVAGKDDDDDDDDDFADDEA